MKRFEITWEYIQTGVSHLNAENLDQAIVKAPDSVSDFGDPKQFKQVTQWNDGWDVKSIAEVKQQ